MCVWLFIVVIHKCPRVFSWQEQNKPNPKTVLESVRLSSLAGTFFKTTLAVSSQDFTLKLCLFQLVLFMFRTKSADPKCEWFRVTSRKDSDKQRPMRLCREGEGGRGVLGEVYCGLGGPGFLQKNTTKPILVRNFGPKSITLHSVVDFADGHFFRFSKYQGFRCCCQCLPFVSCFYVSQLFVV